MAAIRATRLGLLACSCVCSSAFGEPARICELAVKHGGLVPFEVHVDPDRDGGHTVNADLDLDGSNDELRWYDAGPGSQGPAKDASLTLKLSSSRKSFTLQEQRLHVVNFESSYYAVTTRAESELGPWYREVFAVTDKGITRICSFEGKGQIP
jgi:hypothetical protein